MRITHYLIKLGVVEKYLKTVQQMYEGDRSGLRMTEPHVYLKRKKI